MRSPPGSATRAAAPVGTPPAGPSDRLDGIGQAASAFAEARRAWLNRSQSSPEVLKKRTLTTRSNARATWLAIGQTSFDRAAWNDDGWDDPDPAVIAEVVIPVRSPTRRQRPLAASRRARTAPASARPEVEGAGGSSAAEDRIASAFHRRRRTMRTLLADG